MESVEFYYDYISLYGYLVNSQLSRSGLPIFVGDDMFFGNDRLEFVKERSRRAGIFV